jgi:hypothetical protein
MCNRNLLQEMKETVSDGFRKLKNSDNKLFTFSEFFSSDSLANLVISLQGDVIYAPTPTTTATTPATATWRSPSAQPTEPIVLMNFNPIEISKSHLAALALVCNSIVTTERGYSGMTESYRYHPIGIHPSPIGSWSIVSSLESGVSTSTSFHLPMVTSLATQLSQWLQATQNFRLGHHAYLGLFQNRYDFHPSPLLPPLLSSLLSSPPSLLNHRIP